MRGSHVRPYVLNEAGFCVPKFVNVHLQTYLPARGHIIMMLALGVQRADNFIQWISR